jgi:hypothetical protein
MRGMGKSGRSQGPPGVGLVLGVSGGKCGRLVESVRGISHSRATPQLGECGSKESARWRGGMRLSGAMKV